MLEIKTISYSAINSYKSCPQLFKNKYIDKLSYKQSTEEALLVGNWTHSLVEAKIKGETDLNKEFSKNLDKWLADCLVSLSVMEKLKLTKLSFELSHLLFRASNFCNDKTKIRNSNGTVLKSPIDAPSNSFKKELYNLSCYGSKSELDSIACQHNEAFYEINFSWMFAKALYYATIFSIPNWVAETLAVELTFGKTEDDQVPLGIGNKVSLHGFIDWIVKMNDGQIAIIDHKTDKDVPSPEQVLFNPQLNLYAYAYNCLYGRYPDVIGINHLKSKNIVLAKINKKIVNDTISYYSTIYKQAMEGEHIKKHPNDYNSPCLKRSFKTGKILSHCPYLDNCWGYYKEILGI